MIFAGGGLRLPWQSFGSLEATSGATAGLLLLPVHQMITLTNKRTKRAFRGNSSGQLLPDRIVKPNLTDGGQL